MSILDHLASSQNRRDEVPNQELAKRIADKNDREAVKELALHLSRGTKAVKGDCIKVLYEVGERKPSLIAGYAEDFLALLDGKDNRLEWGAMTALDAKALPHLLDQFRSCPTNQLPMYAESVVAVVNPGNRKRFLGVLASRLGKIEKESKRKRVEKVMKRIGAQS